MIQLEGVQIVVCLEGDSLYDANVENRPLGFITKVQQSSSSSYGYDSFSGGSATSSKDFFRLATEKEIRAYHRGIKFTHQIKDEIVDTYDLY